MRGDGAGPILEGTGRLAHTCALVCLCQTMMSSLDPPFEAWGGRADPSFTMSNQPDAPKASEPEFIVSTDRELGGARRDRTDDLMLAKHALYQLSYGPLFDTSWQRQGWS